MSAPTRRTARCLVLLTALPLVLTGCGASALASPDPVPAVGEHAATTPSYDLLPPWLVFPGWRGYMLPPEERGHVLEFLDH